MILPHFSLLLCASLLPQEPTPAATPEQRYEALTFLVSELRSMHPDPFFAIDEEEFTRATALGLFDYARKARCLGYVVSLSGGADSAACAILVAQMVELSVGELGDLTEHGRVLREIRRQAKALDASVCVLQDLQGPKIRTGKLKSGGPVYLETGRKTAITVRPIVGTAACFPTSYRALPGDVGRGARILLDDGLLELRVTSVKGDTVNCRVVVGGALRENKGINLPGVAVSAPALTPKDRRDLKFGLEAGVTRWRSPSSAKPATWRPCGGR